MIDWRFWLMCLVITVVTYVVLNNPVHYATLLSDGVRGAFTFTSTFVTNLTR